MCNLLSSHVVVNETAPPPLQHPDPPVREHRNVPPVPENRNIPSAPKNRNVLPPTPDSPEHASPDSPTIGAHSPTPPSQLTSPSPGFSRGAPLRPTLATAPARPWMPAPLAAGVDPKTPRTANKVYSTAVAGMLNEAQHKFECLLFIEDAYPNIDTQIKWSIECWEEVCSDNRQYFELSKEMLSLVRNKIISNLQTLNVCRSRRDAPTAGVLFYHASALMSTHYLMWPRTSER